MLFWFCHNATSFRAAWSAWEVHDLNNSVGLLLKFVQKLKPSQPSSQGSSTTNKKYTFYWYYYNNSQFVWLNMLPSSMQVLKNSSEGLFKHLNRKSSQEVDQNLVNVFAHNLAHWEELALWQQCHLALSIPTRSILETSAEFETGPASGIKKHCQKYP